MTFFSLKDSNFDEEFLMKYRNFACIRRTFEHKFLTSNRGCVLYTKLENWNVLHSPKATRQDTKSMTQIGLEEKLFAWVQECHYQGRIQPRKLTYTPSKI